MADMEDILVEIGGFGKAQIILELALTSSFFGSSWSMMQMAFMGMIPDWYCVLSDQNTSMYFNTSDMRHLGNNSMTLYKTCVVNGTVCENFRFTGSALTIINEWSLVCDLHWVKPTVISIQMIGVLVGNLIAGQLSDQFGRKKPYYGCIFCHTVMNVIAAFSVSWVMFAVCRFFIGVLIGGMFAVAVPYGLEFLTQKWRSFIGLFPSAVIGVCLFAGVAAILENWVHLHLACAACSILSLAGWFVVPESVRWLAVHGRVEEAVDTMEKLAKINGKPLPATTRTVMEAIAKEEEERQARNEIYSYLDLFKSWYLAKVTIVIGFIWCVMSLVTYGVSFAVSSLSGNIYLNISAMVLLEVPFIPPMFYIMNKFGRRCSSVLIFSISCAAGVGCVIAVLVEPENSNSSVTNWLLLTAKVGVGSAWSVVCIWGAELYPTVLRNVGYGTANMAARIGGMAAPFLINLDEMVVGAYGIISGLTFLVILACLTLPETKNQALPDSLSTHKNGTELTIIKPESDIIKEDVKIRNVKTSLVKSMED